ncbi:MAG: tRNA (N(6)-L-threonylcarbamoyladenosine(37)-C(2))-methylthiotransferase MtaB [Dehalococcoidaceae bacterium]|nr:tRNA (N(6)-L-threonylcarbamoyladenosine(37)-C(2))-methylthiotransferase MtaB [Dehalococcoidaceae bacterium]
MDTNNAHMTVSIDSLGCKLNQAEAESLTYDFVRAGCRVVLRGMPADICVLNSCTVTHVADRKARQWLRRMRRLNPESLMVITGCYAERSAQEISGMDGNVLVIGNSGKLELVETLIDRGLLKVQPAPVLAVGRNCNRTRSFIRIQEGCANWCAYCVVPAVRKNPYSREPGEVVAEIRQRYADGFKEVVLTGTEIGTYSSGGCNLEGLIARILNETGIERIRLTSLQPHEITPGLLEMWSDGRLCPHFHLSLQSGSDSVLRRMGRNYTTARYSQTLEEIYRRIPDVAITTDVIVGFPGETADEFGQTLDLCRQAGFARIHVFPYSARPLTAAAGMSGQVDAKIKKEREAAMLSLAREQAQAYLAEFEGRTMPVLWAACSGGVWSGLTHNYIRVYARGNPELGNRITPVCITGLWRDGVWGELP